MKKTKVKLLSVLLFAVMLLNLMLTACSPAIEDITEAPTDAPTQAPTEDEGKNPTDDNNKWVVPEGEYTLEKEDGYNQVTFYWTLKGADYETCDLWAWWDGKEGSGYLFHECDYGAKAVINVPAGITQVGFIVRRDCSEPGGSSWGDATKDVSEDRFAILDGTDTYIWLKSGDTAQYTTTDGINLTEIKKFTLAGITSLTTIDYNITPKFKITSMDQMKLYQGDTEIKIESISSLNKTANKGTITTSEPLDISKPYRLVLDQYGEKPVVPTKIFDSQEFLDNYIYDGNDLGATINGSNTTFKVWAPTASKVVLNLYESGHEGSAYKQVDMVLGEKGVWSHTEECGHGTYYTYTVTTSVGTQTATDPYAKSAGLNGNRSMVIDLSLTNPDGWDADRSFSTGIKHYSDATIWEVHVRDFSNKIATSNYKGKYLAFTETGLVNSHGVPVGIDYLKGLGITHVHLLPVYDYATVNEADPDSGFNWGYDPKNYNVPEGSYSTDPYNGAVRVNEFKQMVQALHEAGIGVIMDVVYNHTYDANSSFNKIVPYYYYRYTSTGTNSSASGCGNDTASERAMFGKFMVESVKYWLEEYNLDGFRFDLMGLHDINTMKEIEKAVHEIDPEAIIYGEGWTMGSLTAGYKQGQANQTNISQIKPTNGAVGSVAVFNDVIRDALKGSVFSETSTGFISGSAAGCMNGVQFGIAGGSAYGQSWKVTNAMVINYMSAHDNHTLWDKLALSCPDATVEERLAMNRLGAAILMVSQGTPFMQAGEEMLRTKDGDHNSYKSSDEINNIDWEKLVPGSAEYEMMQYYKGLIAMRKAFSIFKNGSSVGVSFKNIGGGAFAVIFDDHVSSNGSNDAVVVINPTQSEINYDLGTGTYNLVATSTQAGAETIATASGNVSVNALGINVYIKA